MVDTALVPLLSYPLAKKIYYKWHDSYTHTTNEYNWRDCLLFSVIATISDTQRPIDSR
jgi:hypothetical protein